MSINVIGKARKFNVAFGDVTLTTNAGIVLVRDFIDRLALPHLLDAHLHLKQRQRGYPESQLILSLCWNAILGGDCLRDLQVLRGDAGLPKLLGVDAVLAPTTAGEVLRRFTMGKLADLRRILQLAAAAVRPWQKSSRLTIDLDASLYAQASSQKQGSRMNYKGEVGYNPLFAFWAEEREMLATHLLRGTARASSKAVYFLEQILKQAPAGKALFLRGDSEFYMWELIGLCEQRQITYAITADLSPSLPQAIAALPQKAWKFYAPGSQVAELKFTPHGQTEHRYVVKREVVVAADGESQERLHAVVTNDKRKGAKKLMQWALQRCAMENFLKEHKNDFGFEKMPSQSFHANWAWLLISQLAWNVVAWFRRQCLPEDCHKLQLKSIRHRLLKVAGKLVRHSRQRFLVMSEENQFQEWWSFAINQLAQLTPISP